jgi:hypothetical protein
VLYFAQIRYAFQPKLIEEKQSNFPFGLMQFDGIKWRYIYHWTEAFLKHKLMLASHILNPANGAPITVPSGHGFGTII